MYLKEITKKILPETVSRRIKTYKDKQEKFYNEIKLLNGKKIDRNTTKSVLFFTTHKCASTYMGKCIRYINGKYLNLTHLDFMLYLWMYSNQDTFQLLENKKSIVFYPEGMLYSPLRKYVPVPEIDQYCILLMLRDPRDVIVSEYFSVAYSHVLSPHKMRKEELLNRRSQVQKMTVDEYALEKAKHYQQVYSEYCNHLIKAQNIKFLRYEDFMQNFNFWIQQLEDCLKISISEEDRDRLYELKGGDAEIIENKLKHIRKGTPGDYKNKLTEETQDFLNSKFKEILLTLNYE
ncbi:MAG: sulfotransferase domain-containing protein [Cyanobacteria bacterium P01_D01_bin.44]